MAEVVSLEEVWTKTIKNALTGKDFASTMGHLPLFPWKEFSHQIAQHLGLSFLDIALESWEQYDAEKIRHQLGKKSLFFAFSLDHIEEHLYWGISQEESIALLSWVLQSDETSCDHLILDNALSDSFFTYLQLVILREIKQFEPFTTLCPHMQDISSLPEGEVVCLNIALEHNKKKVRGKIFYPPHFTLAWKDYFAKNALSSRTNVALPLQTTVALEIDRIALSCEEWQKIREDDILTLPGKSSDLSKNIYEGRLLLDNQSIFSVRVQNGKIKLVDPLFHQSE